MNPSTAMARPQEIRSVGVTLSGSAGVPADWSTGTYAYDGAGNITAMGGESYTYDKVSRLVSSTRNGEESYTFDAFGNLIAMNGLLRTTDPATNRLTEATYDRRGNLLAWGGQSFTWDTMGRMTSMQGPGINRSMFYDAHGERIVVRDGTGYTFTLRDLGQQVLREVSSSSATGWKWGKDYVYRDGVLLASHSTSAGEGLRYHVPDHLTSPRLLTNRCGERAVDHRASSFGVDVLGGSSQSADRMRLTMHERDLGQLSTTLDDLDYMHARTYWPSLGRFMSVDPLRGTPSRPQSFNLFGYVEERPVSFIDPWGLQAYDLGLRDTIQVMGEDPGSEAPPGVSCEEYRTASEFLRRMLWESARQRAQEREDPMLTILREVESIFPSHLALPRFLSRNGAGEREPGGAICRAARGTQRDRRPPRSCNKFANASHIAGA